MHVVWVSSASDNEFDLTAAIARHNDISLTLYILSDPQDKNHVYHMSQLTRSPNIIINEISTEQVDGVLRYWSTQPKDLLILRHPTWINSEDRAKEIAEIIKDQPYIISSWEWVPNYAMAQMPPLLAWKRIACTNSQDIYRAKMSFPDKQILKLPFGVVDRTKEELAPSEQYSTDLVCDAQPHYECLEYNGIKRISVDRMIKPALELPYKLALWGSRYGNTTNCDWGATDGFKPYHHGSFFTSEYPRVYASSKIYLGVSWNYGTGGFSVRLARALSCGVMTIWHETEGRKDDIPEGIVAWSKSYEHTGVIINHYMKRDVQREKMAKRAKEFVMREWEWGTQLKRLVGEIQ
jgi:hypothetical protein